MLHSLGVSPEAESVYMAMLGHPEAGITEVAAELGVTQVQVRSALDELARLSLLRASQDLDGGFRPVSPEVGLEALLARERAEVARRQQEVEESRVGIAQLISKHAALRSEDNDACVERLVGIDQIRDKLEVLARECEWEADSFAPGGAQSAESLTASRKLDQEAIDRGVHIRTIYLDSVRSDQPTLDYATWMRDLGSEVRTAPTLPLRMLVVDRNKALVPVDNEHSGKGALLLTGTSIVAALRALFLSVWREATPLGAKRARDELGLSLKERRIIQLWSGGHTDEKVARELAVSLRTVRRIGADLMGRLNARSRFQAGALAVTRGWIDPVDLE